MEEQRKTDLAFFNRYYESSGSGILVVYGHRNVEFDSLIQRFMQNKRSYENNDNGSHIVAETSYSYGSFDIS